MKKEELKQLLLDKGYVENRWGSFDKWNFNEDGELTHIYRYKLSDLSFSKWVKRPGEGWHRLNSFKTWYYSKFEIKEGRITRVKA